MEIEIVTKGYLQAFRLQLLEDIKRLVQPSTIQEKKWLRTSEVRAMLKISAGTLQNLRIKAILHPVKLSNMWFYDANEIEKLFESGIE
ncbi:MAG: helix-turn-helix domain-containing protein [Flavipsychrobacter sp.]|nr:helix-turn-helix domain-containing protein [Flavipsychrobacter sp.]